MKIQHDYNDRIISYAKITHDLAVAYAQTGYKHKLERLSAETDDPEKDPFLKNGAFRERASYFLGLYNEFVSYAENNVPEN